MLLSDNNIVQTNILCYNNNIIISLSAISVSLYIYSDYR